MATVRGSTASSDTRAAESSYSYTSTVDVMTYRRVRPANTRRAISACLGV